MRSFSISFAAPDRRLSAGAALWRGLLCALLIVAVALPAAARKKKSKRPKQRPVEELINPLLGPEYSTWLVGPISWIAAESDIRDFLLVTEDAAAKSFVEAFWKRNDPEPRFEANPNRELFDERLSEAEKLYREGSTPGHRTDRGTVYVVYGPPEEVSFEAAPRPGLPPVEIWDYPKDAEEGLDGRKPLRQYKFYRPGEKTVFYNRSQADRDRSLQDRRDRARRPGFGPP